MPAPNLDALLALVGPDASTGVSAPMPRPQPMTPQLAAMPALPTSPSPERTAGPTGHNPLHVPWEELLRQLGPIAIASAMHGPHQTGFLQGFQEGQTLSQQRHEQAQKEADAKTQAAEQFKLHIFDQARQIQDPQEWASFVNLATESALHMGLISDPSEMKSFLTFPQHLQDSARSKELLDKLGVLMKRPDFNDLMTHGATLTLRDGSHVSLHDAVTMTGALPEVAGQPVGPPPKPSDVPNVGSFEDFVLRQYGKNPTPADITAARQAYQQSAKPQTGSFEDYVLRSFGPNPTPTQLEQARKKWGDLGRDTPTPGQGATIAPNTPAFRTAQDIAYGKLTFPQIRTLLAYNRDANFKIALYDKARELNPDFDPAQYEIGFKMAINPQNRQRLVAIDALMPVIDRIKALSAEVPRGNVQAFNKLLQSARLQVSNKTVANLDQLSTLLGDEVGLALGVGSGSDLKTRLGLSMVNTSLGSDAFNATMDQLANTLQARKQAILKPMGVYAPKDENASPTASGPKRFEIISVK